MCMKYKILTNFSLSRKAKTRIDEIKKDNKDIFIRIMIVKGGCAGHQYYILMDDYIGDNDYVLMKNSNQTQKNKKERLVYVVVDEASLDFIKNGKLDFDDNIEFSGFKIINPNAKTICNCGNSFSCSNDCVVQNKKTKKQNSKCHTNPKQ